LLPPLPIAVVTERNMAALARRLQEKRQGNGGHRTILTGECAKIDASAEALELAKTIAAGNRYVLVVDWSPSDQGFAESAGLDPKKGFNDLLRGDALFDQIIHRLPGSTVHAIASGKAFDDPKQDIDPDQLNLILDALDEAYDFIIVTGRHDEARKLFETIEGRFDAGIIVDEPPRLPPILEDISGTFLGFEVADIDLIRFERTRPSATEPPSEPIVRAAVTRSMPLARQA
jgi:Mrp family chromosome partitioning ATPase